MARWEFEVVQGNLGTREGGRSLWRNGDGVVNHAGFAMIDWLRVRIRR